MSNAYTSPVTTVFELQRASIEQSQQALEQSVAFQQNVGQAFVDSLDSQESAQRRGVELSQTLVHNYLDTVESTIPGAAGSVDELRSAVDEQVEFLLENHEEAFEAFEGEFAEGVEAYDELTDDYIAALDEQVSLLVEAHEELETQSVEAVEQMADQVEDLQDQVEEVQEQVQDVQQQAAEAVEVDVEA
jgi:DNA repair exonuclease SbcCD ATPase subunit